MDSCCKYILGVLLARPYERVLAEPEGDEALVDRLISEVRPDRNACAGIRATALALLADLRKKYGGA